MDETMAEVLRRKTPAERIGIGFALWSSARRMLLAHLAASHPDWDEPITVNGYEHALVTNVSGSTATVRLT